MPLFYQQDINLTTRLAVWKIEEDESFFSRYVPLQREITHPHKRLQHLAGRLLLRELFPGFPYDLVQIADTRKPFLPDQQYHFSISHAGDYAAAISSTDHRVGVDVEQVSPRVMKVLHKFLDERERTLLEDRFPEKPVPYRNETLFWSVKETLFKWHGEGGIDFREHLHIREFTGEREGHIPCSFSVLPFASLDVHYRNFPGLCLSWAAAKAR
jgi:phosphopantetheinyl transferase